MMQSALVLMALRAEGERVVGKEVNTLYPSGLCKRREARFSADLI